MIHILLILLAVLGIILVAIATILFIPIRYRIKVEKLFFEFHASWLFKLLNVSVCYKNKTFDWKIRIAWKKIEKKDETDQLDDADFQEEDVELEEASNNGFKKKKKEDSVKESLFSKIKCTIINICDKIKQIWATKKKITDFITDDKHLMAFGKVKKEVFVLLKKIVPYHLKGYVRFGCEDPYNTGRILALLSAMYPFYGEKIDIYPEFEQKIFHCDLHAKGRIRNIALVIAIFNLFFDKNVRLTYKHYMSLKG